MFKFFYELMIDFLSVDNLIQAYLLKFQKLQKDYVGFGPLIFVDF